MRYDHEAVAARLRALREHNRLTQRELARVTAEIGEPVSYGSISQIERRQRKRAGPDVLDALAHALKWQDWDAVMATDALDPPAADGAVRDRPFPPDVVEQIARRAAYHLLELADPEHRHLVLGALRQRLAEHEARDSLAEVPERSSFIPGPVVSPPVAGTTGAVHRNGDHVSGGAIDDEAQLAPQAGRTGLLAIRVGQQATCMRPYIEPGDVVWFDPRQQRPRDGEAVVYVRREDPEHPVVHFFARRGRTYIVYPVEGEQQIYAEREVEIKGVVARVLKPPPPRAPLPIPRSLGPGVHDTTD